MATADEPLRIDETHKRLLDWTYGQPPSERLAAQILDDADYKDIDPSHPLGGPDGGRDGECTRDGESGVWAVYFPRGQQTPKEIEDKLKADIEAARKHDPEFLAFVTNQELRQSERTHLRSLGGDIRIDLFHLERVATILDRPRMAAVREHYLRIPATHHPRPPETPDHPPLSIKASVVGTAHAFTDDTELLDRFVWMREQRIRERSDEGHARVRAEREAKERAEQEKRDQKAREKAERARKEAMDAVVPKRPWDVGIDMPRMTDILGQSGLLDSIAKQYSSPTEFLPRLPGMGEPPKPPEPLSEEQIQEKVAAYRAELEARWPACRDYLAGVAWPAMLLRIENEVESFPTDVQVILTFHGALGVDLEGLAAFKFEKVRDPSWQPSADPRFGTVYWDPPRLARPSDYPIEWRHNDEGDLEVTVTLPQLRPHPPWRSETHGDDIVLVVDPHVDIDEVTVTYTATAHGYGKVFVGNSFTVPVEKVAMLDVLRGVMDATRDAS